MPLHVNVLLLLLKLLISHRFMVSCVYIANATQSMIFQTVSHFKEPYADVGKGELTVSLRLSKGMQTVLAFQVISLSSVVFFVITCNYESFTRY